MLNMENKKYLSSVASFKEMLSSKSGFQISLTGEYSIFNALFNDYDASREFHSKIIKMDDFNLRAAYRAFLSNLPMDISKNLLDEFITTFELKMNTSLNDAKDVSFSKCEEMTAIHNSAKKRYNERTIKTDWSKELGLELLKSSSKISKLSADIRRQFLMMNVSGFDAIINAVETMERGKKKLTITMASKHKPKRINPVGFENHLEQVEFKNASQAVNEFAKHIRNKNYSKFVAYLFARMERSSMKGGAEKIATAKDADVKRIEINKRFAASLFKQLDTLTNVMRELRMDKDPRLIEFFSDPISKLLTDAIWETRITSLAYIPHLSGYFRTAEATARRDRYVKQLQTSIEGIERVLKTHDLGNHAKNSLYRIINGYRSIINLINTTIKEMDAVFVNLASSEIDRIIAGDSELSKGIGFEKKPLPEKEIGVQSNSYIKYIDEVELLKARVEKAPSQHAVLMALDKFKDYKTFGRAKMEAAAKKRLEILKNEYEFKIANVDIGKREKLRGFVETKLASIRDLYTMLVNIDELFSKIYTNSLISSDVREDLFMAIANVTIEKAGEGAFKARIDRVVSELKALFFGNDLKYMNENGILEIKTETNDYKKLHEHITMFLNSVPTLKLFITLVNILEKHDKFNADDIYTVIVKYIVYSAIEFDDGNMISTPDKQFVKSTREEANAEMVENNYPCPKIIKNDEKDSDKSALYIRHASAKLTVEDKLFIMTMQAIAGRLLYQLDLHRSEHFKKRTFTPGTERLLVGGGNIDDPIGFSGSTDVIPEAAGVYAGILRMFMNLKKYFIWERNGDEPQLVVSLPKGSSSRDILLKIYEDEQSDMSKKSDAFFMAYIPMVNRAWHSFSNVNDPEKRETQIFDSMLDEIGNSLVLMTATEEGRIKMEREEEKQSAYSTYGTVSVDDAGIKLYKEDEMSGIKMEAFESIKRITRAIFDIVNEVQVSEVQLSNDYKSWIDRIKDRLMNSPAADRFRVLTHALRTADEVAGDNEVIFTGFTEFVTTSLVLAAGLFEKVIYSGANLLYAININNIDKNKLVTDAVLATRLPGKDYIKIRNKKPGIELDYSNLIAYFDDVQKMLLSCISPFTRLGDRDTVEKYMSAFGGWNPNKIISDMQDILNEKLKNIEFVTDNKYVEIDGEIILQRNAGEPYQFVSVFSPSATMDGRPIHLTSGMWWSEQVCKVLFGDMATATHDGNDNLYAKKFDIYSGISTSDDQSVDKIDIINKLIAKMEYVLTIQGENPVLLYELASEISSHSSLQQYFKGEQVTFVDNATKKNYSWFKYTDVNQSIKKYGEIKLSDPITDKSFICDTILYPISNSTSTKSRKRLDDVSSTDLSKYISFIPQFITAFKDIYDQIIIDDEFMTVKKEKIPLIKTFLLAIIESLYKTYKIVREKYGLQTHMELAKGDFDSYLDPSGHFDSSKLSTPLSILMGIANVKDNKPIVMLGLGDPKYYNDTLGLSWLAESFDKDLYGDRPAPIESIPWTIDLAKRVETLTGANVIDFIPQWLKALAHLAMLYNNSNMIAMNCYNPFISRGQYANITHLHLIEYDLKYLNEPELLDDVPENLTYTVSPYTIDKDEKKVKLNIDSSDVNIKWIATKISDFNNNTNLDEKTKEYRNKNMYLIVRPAYGKLGKLSYKDWHANRTKIGDNRKEQIGRNNPDCQSQIELARIYFMSFDDEENKKMQDRLTAGMFLYLKRNPVSLSNTLTLVPFPNIFNFSQIFETYFRVQQKRFGKVDRKARSYLPKLLLNPTYIGKDVRNELPEKYDRLTEKVLSKDNEPRYEDVYYNGIGDHKYTSIPEFYELSEIGGKKIGFMHPTDTSAEITYMGFPMFAAYIRFIDQLGVALKDEYKERIKEIEPRKIDSTVTQQPGFVNIMG
jgi:hypothetical protein